MTTAVTNAGYRTFSRTALRPRDREAAGGRGVPTLRRPARGLVPRTGARRPAHRAGTSARWPRTCSAWRGWPRPCGSRCDRCGWRKQRGGLFIDALTGLQVEKSAAGPAEIVARDRNVGAEGGERPAADARARPRPRDAGRADGGTTPSVRAVDVWAISTDVILTRDPWMHRSDIAAATGRPMTLTQDHDGLLVADVVESGPPATVSPAGDADRPGGREYVDVGIGRSESVVRRSTQWSSAASCPAAAPAEGLLAQAGAVLTPRPGRQTISTGAAAGSAGTAGRASRPLDVPGSAPAPDLPDARRHGAGGGEHRPGSSAAAARPRSGNTYRVRSSSATSATTPTSRPPAPRGAPG